eukprot:3315012-Pyramimonas_sp.AAC.1
MLIGIRAWRFIVPPRGQCPKPLWTFARSCQGKNRWARLPLAALAGAPRGARGPPCTGAHREVEAHP